MVSPYNYRWQQVRRIFLHQHPLCIECMKRGVLTASSVVDHIVPHRGDARLFWDHFNWQALCRACHDSRKAMIERGQKIEPHESWK